MKLPDYKNVIPMVIESSGRGERAYDIYSLLFRERIIFVGTGIDDQVANAVVAQLLVLSREDPDADSEHPRRVRRRGDDFGGRIGPPRPGRR